MQVELWEPQVRIQIGSRATVNEAGHPLAKRQIGAPTKRSSLSAPQWRSPAGPNHPAFAISHSILACYVTEALVA
jgi:hypothetical protein